MNMTIYELVLMYFSNFDHNFIFVPYEFQYFIYLLLKTVVGITYDVWKLFEIIYKCSLKYKKYIRLISASIHTESGEKT